MINRVGSLILLICAVQLSFSQTGDDDYYLGQGFNSGDTVYTNSGTFWDAGGLNNYGTNEQWTVWFCSNNGNPITFDFSDFATDYRGTFPNPGLGEFRAYDYLTVYYGGDSAHAYHDDTPEFTFTSPDGCVGFRFRSQPTSLTHNGWDAEISANPPPSNNDPCTAAALIVGNVCAPSVFNNKGAYGTGIGSPACHTFFGGDVWFTAEVPVSGELKVETFAGTLDWAVMVLYTGADCNSLTELFCDETTSAMPTRILTGRTPGETIYIRIFGDQAKSGTFGICASDPSLPIEGYTGPGGVGNDTENDLWLRSDKGVLNSGGTDASPGQQVQTWNDHSGNENHVTQPTPADQPLLTGNAINGQPALTFNGTSQHMTGELEEISAPLTMITVNRFTAAATDAYVMTIGDLNANQTVSVSRETDNNYYAFTQGAKYYGPAMADNTPYIIHARHNIASVFHEVFLNETAFATADYGTSVITDGSLILGASRNIDTFLGGDIAEAIVYNNNLNSAQKIIVENYLAAKYGIIIPTDRYAHQAVHGYDVAGIGQVDAGNQHTDAQSARILAVGNPTDLDDGEFLLFGHDNGDISSWITTDLPNNDLNLLRVEREWRVNATGGDGMGIVTVSLFDTIMPAFPPEFLSFILWVDEDGDFTTDAIPYPVVRAGNQYIANSVNLPDGYYMTVGCIRPVAGFTLPASAGFESVANPQIEVSLNYGVSTELTLQYQAIDGSATGGGIDYLLNPDALTFLPGTKTAIIVPLIIDNDIAEPDKNFEVRISSPSLGLILSADSIHTYTILNDDIEVTAITDTDSIGSCFPAVANLGVNVVGTGPYTFAWTPTDSLSDPGIADPVANPTISTLYVVEVTDQTNGAVGTDSILITVLTAPAQPTITAGGPTTFCSGDSVQLSSSAGTAYLWSTGETTQDIWASISGSFTVSVFDDMGCSSLPSDPVLVTAKPYPALPVITASGPVTFCEGDSVDLTSSLASTYLWSNGDTNQTIRVKSNGSLYVQITDTSGCQSIPSATTTVTVYNLPPSPVITVNGSTDVCENDSVILTSSPGIAYLWSTGDTTQSIAVNTAGDFTVQTINGVGCLSIPSGAVTITIRPAPGQPTITYTGNTTFCEGDSLVLTSSAGTTYLWSSGETTQSISAKTTGSYTVRVTNADGCFSLPSDPVDVSVNAGPEKPTITGNNEYCTGDSVMLSGPPASAYLWSTGETTSTIYVKSGNYTLTVSNADGCSSPDSDPFTVSESPKPPKPVITPAGPIELESGESVILVSSAATTYSWSPGGETTSSITVRDTGNYTVATGNEFGCPSDPSDPVTVTLLSLNKPVITVTGETELCEGAPATTLSAPLSDAYLWSTGETSQSILVAVTGSYTVTVYNSSGAESPPSDPVDINVFENPVLNLSSKSDATCYGETSGSIEVIASGGTSPYTYTWDNGETGSGLTGIGAGTYLVTATDAYGCQDTLSESIGEPAALVINETITHPSCGDSYDGAVEVSISGGTPGYMISWSNGSTGERTEKLGPGTIDVDVTDENQCLANESYTLIAETDVCIVPYEIITPNSDGHNDTWEITGIEFYPNTTVDVYDRWGKRVYHSNGYPQPWDGTHDGKVLPMDSYHYIINLNNGTDPIIGNITIVK
jgi:gliding motility-associated-like protein